MPEADNGWIDEMRSAYLYRVLAEVERGTPRAQMFDGLAKEAREQASIWAKSAKLAAVPEFKPDLRTRVVAALARRYGPRAIRGILAAMKVRGLSVYSHAAPGHPATTSVDEVGKRHRGVAGQGNLRAAVFGVNDGLVSNVSLILGVAGASPSPGVIVLSGVAGLLAGAFSMAAGEYVSVRSQREMYEHQIGLERAELAEYPKAEAEELALIYAARGMPQAEAHALATRTIADPRQALDTLAREELGLNPDELGSPWGAALASFLSFAIGAAVPLVPFLAAGGERALAVSIALTAVSLFAVGALISLFTGRSALRDGLRMLAIGAGAGAITYAIGRAMGVGLG
ncbi:MAG TPA: VIT1/CCC1 transporter family protein [Burkholderiales bacterium]